MKSFVVISLVVVLKVFGDVCLSHGMGSIGEVELLNPLAMLGLGFRTLTNPWVILAMVLLLTYSLLYLSSLSWLDLSYMIPMTTSGYALNALFAWLLLGEEVDLTRWIGTFIIMIGVLVVGLGGYRRSRRNAINASKR